MALVLVEVVVPVLALKVLALVLKVLALVLKVPVLAQMVLAFVQMAGGRVVPILVVNVPVLRHPKGVMRRVVKKARLVSLGQIAVGQIAVGQIVVGQQRLLLTMGATILIRLSGLTMHASHCEANCSPIRSCGNAIFSTFARSHIHWNGMR